jgi:hypothetical protein
VKIPDYAVASLVQLVKEFLPRTVIPAANRWRQLSDDALWKHVVSQVAVVGGSASHARLTASSVIQEAMRFERLQGLTEINRRRIINESLRDAGVRYASQDVEKCRKTDALEFDFQRLKAFAGGPRGYFASLADRPDDDARVEQVTRDMRYIKLKGARDLLAELGVVSNVLAFDVRLVNILRAVGIEVPADVTTDASRYREFQDSLLLAVCQPIGITGVALDRVLYQNYKEIMRRFPASSTLCGGPGADSDG